MKQSLILLCLAFAVYSCSNDSNEQDETRNEQSSSEIQTVWDTLLLEKEGGNCFDDENNCITIRFGWMQAVNKDEYHQKLNQKIKKFLLGNYADSSGQEETLAAQYLRDYADISLGDYDIKSGWQIEKEMSLLENPLPIISFRLDTYELTGGVNPSSLVSFLNLNREDLSHVRLDQLFQGGYEDSLGQLANYYFKQDQKLLLKSAPADFSIDFKEDKYRLNDNFGFDERGMVFVLNNFELNNTDETVEFTIPYEALQNSGLLKIQF